MPDPGPSSPPRGPSTDEARSRLLRALTTPGRSQVVVAALMLILGLGVVTQVRANDLDNSYAGYREQELIDLLTSLSVAAQRADAELARLEETRSDLRSATTRRQAALAEATSALDTYSVLAGLVPVSGPGVRMTITEATGRAQLDTMIDTIQELRNAGAEAISINGQVRVVAQTPIGETVGGLLVDDVELTAPYVVEAIGEPSTLSTGMSFRSGPVDQLEADGAEALVEELTAITIEVVRQPVKPVYAEPDPAS